MRAFTRTASGIANYHKFHRADFTVFIEGRLNEDSESDGVLYKDVRYYVAVLKSASSGRVPKIKCLGDRQVVLEYANKIISNEIKNSFVLIDKDLDGVINSVIDSAGVIRTYGYSWENELWSDATIVYVVSQLTGGSARALNDAHKYTADLLKKIKYLSVLDAAAQVTGSALLKKSSSLCGVGFNFPYLSTKEVTRVSEKFRNMGVPNCPVAMEVARYAVSKEPVEVVQGHFWANVAMRLIAALYKKHTGDTAPSNGVLENLALSGLVDYAQDLLGANLLRRYKAELARIGI